MFDEIDPKVGETTARGSMEAQPESRKTAARNKAHLIMGIVSL
jgi:hypothetical protein